MYELNLIEMGALNQTWKVRFNGADYGYIKLDRESEKWYAVGTEDAEYEDALGSNLFVSREACALRLCAFRLEGEAIARKWPEESDEDLSTEGKEEDE